MALQLAADHPDVVRRLVVAGAGYRLSQDVARDQVRYAEALAAGRRGLQHTAPRTPPTRRWLSTSVLWLADPYMRPRDPADLLAFVRAEAAFDVGGRLDTITAPTLVAVGAKDPTYPREIIRDTASGIDGARLLVYPRTGHLGILTNTRFIRDVTGFLRKP